MYQPCVSEKLLVAIELRPPVDEDRCGATLNQVATPPILVEQALRRPVERSYVSQNSSWITRAQRGLLCRWADITPAGNDERDNHAGRRHRIYHVGTPRIGTLTHWQKYPAATARH